MFYKISGRHPSFILLSALFLLILNGCSTSTIKDGKLPKNFSWAYGSWDIADTYSVKEYGRDENVFDENAGTWVRKTDIYKVFIGKDYVQIINPEELKNYKYPFVEATPKQELNWELLDSEEDDYSEDFEEKTTEYEEDTPAAIEEVAPAAYEEPFEVDADIIYIPLRDSWGYETRGLFLNRKNKTISKYRDFKEQNVSNKTKKSKTKIGEKTLAEYESMLASCPFIGEWQNIRDRYERMTITAEDIRADFIPQKDGTWKRNGGGEYKYDSQNDRLIQVLTGDGYETPETDTFKRYDAEQERIEELKRVITSKTFSYMRNDVYSNTTLLHSYKFNSNGTGTKALYEVQPWGRNLLSSDSVEWEIDGETLKVYDSSARSGYDLYTIRQSIFGNSIVDGQGNVYD